ncbi:MAG: hypothetical protein KDD22_00835 [Bdellovibrionales bacterium]|nr:hypothetical protein [Bdellovibrionales bacterium]
MLKASLLFLLMPLTVYAGDWTRLNDGTLNFEGPIGADEFVKFSEVYDERVKLLIVNSGGGETSAAMEIGFALHKGDVAIEVRNWCLSSCANYFFTGATARIINGGIVGFHGNVKACFWGDNWPKTRSELQEQGLSYEQIEAFHKNMQIQVETEQRFLELVGVSQELFDRSCTSDKGMGSDKEYSFLLPTQKTFEKYGIFNVVGSQDPKIIEEFPGLLVVD